MNVIAGLSQEEKARWVSVGEGLRDGDGAGKYAGLHGAEPGVGVEVVSRFE